MSFRKVDTPPVGEELHLPGPSWMPLLNAIGLAIAILGLAVSLFLTAAGGILFLVTLVRWARETKQSINELPAKH